MVFYLHAPPSMESFCMVARYGWCLQGVVDVLTLNNYQFLLFYCSYFKPQSCQVIKKEKSEKPVPRREHASKEALFFIVSYSSCCPSQHSLSPFLFPSFSLLFPIYIAMGSEFALSTGMGRYGEWLCFSTAGSICMSTADPQICGRTFWDDILPLSPQIQFRHDYITSQNTFQKKSRIQQQRFWSQHTYSSDAHPASIASKTRWLFENDMQIGFWKLAKALISFQIHYSTIYNCKDIIKIRLHS